MATLEQELMADFAESGSEGGDYDDRDDLEQLEKDFGGGGSGSPTPSDEEDMVDEEAAYDAEQKKKKQKAPSDIRSASNLILKLRPVLAEIEQTKDKMEGLLEGEQIEDNPEYKLLTQANDFSTSIDGEISTVHKFIRDHYSIRYPLLEEMVKNPIDYAKTVAVLGNQLNDVKRLSQSADNMVGVPLKSILDGPLLMVISLEATRANGRDLDDNELSLIMQACSIVLELDKARRSLTEFTTSRMALYAPNLTALVGSEVAAQLISFAGGISNLASVPSSNLPSLGANKSTATGMATNTSIRQGFLYHSPIVKGVRQDLRKNAMRILAGKAVLASRVDRVHESPDGATGRQLREECERRLDKLTEAPKNQGVRALPAPDEKPAKKRGGRKARAAKAATAMTEIRKAQNRMAFGKEEKEVGYGDNVKGMGMIGATDTGRLRAQQIDQRTRAKLSKKNPGWGGSGTSTSLGAATSLKGFGGGTATALRAQGLRAGGVGASAGTSSVAFTPVQGLELVDPKVRESMDRKRKADEDKWFKGGTFTQINGGAASNGTPAKVDSAGFKVPSLPNKKPKLDG
ncbi:hypothetical protein BDV96DRAFT_565590 [Lophiotrema nucula]|uniref:Nop domain-containing protein n=1 Tax=Lophiotrema nucula TaxID=690887 RepID=A0A6A5ZMJ0_9PLEO|nr:hypothetical protein BDV96DRAFT_565590 [Lophiotrema nucula]